jgi:hypothetical protein
MRTKSTLTCTNCGKIGHSVETCHNKKKVRVMPTPIVTIEHVVGIKTQPIKSGNIY